MKTNWYFSIWQSHPDGVNKNCSSGAAAKLPRDGRPENCLVIPAAAAGEMTHESSPSGRALPLQLRN